jgi:hypothetical protein
MTNDRDDLAALVEAYINVGTQDPFDAADAIIAAGWRPPERRCAGDHEMWIMDYFAHCDRCDLTSESDDFR